MKRALVESKDAAEALAGVEKTEGFIDLMETDRVGGARL